VAPASTSGSRPTSSDRRGLDIWSFARPKRHIEKSPSVRWQFLSVSIPFTTV
jgi:hypothetical protein